MSEYLNKTIAALTSELAYTFDGERKTSESSYDDVTQFILEQLDRMPWLLSLGIKTCTLVFGAGLIFSEGSLSSSGKMRQATAQVEAWRKSKSGICRNLMRFYTSLVVLSLYSRPEADRSGDAA